MKNQVDGGAKAKVKALIGIFQQPRGLKNAYFIKFISRTYYKYNTFGKLQMKIISSTRKPEIKLPPFWITTNLFLDILEDTFGRDTDITVVVEQRSGESKIEFSGIDEMRSNSAIIETPLSVRVGSLKVNLFGYRQSLEYDEDTQIEAKNLARRLSSYTPLIYYFPGNFPQWLFSFSIGGIFLYLSEPSYYNFFGSIVYMALAKLFLYNVFGLMMDHVIRAKVYHVEKTNIFSRNRDTLFVALIVAIFSFALGILFPTK